MKVSNLFEHDWDDDYSYADAKADEYWDRIDSLTSRLRDDVWNVLADVNIPEDYVLKWYVDFNVDEWTVDIWREPAMDGGIAVEADRKEFNATHPEDYVGVSYQIDTEYEEIPRFDVSAKTIARDLEIHVMDLSNLIDDPEAEIEIKNAQKKALKDRKVSEAQFFDAEERENIFNNWVEHSLKPLLTRKWNLEYGIYSPRNTRFTSVCALVAHRVANGNGGKLIKMSLERVEQVVDDPTGRFILQMMNQTGTMPAMQEDPAEVLRLLNIIPIDFSSLVDDPDAENALRKHQQDYEN
jgi:hypothetical protein